MQCVAGNTKDWMRGTWLQPAAGTAWRSSAEVSGFQCDLFASPGEKGKASLRIPPIILVVNNSDECGSQKKLI